MRISADMHEIDTWGQCAHIHFALPTLCVKRISSLPIRLVTCMRRCRQIGKVIRQIGKTHK
jgi:hypothetical protein